MKLPNVAQGNAEPQGKARTKQQGPQLHNPAAKPRKSGSSSPARVREPSVGRSSKMPSVVPSLHALPQPPQQPDNGPIRAHETVLKQSGRRRADDQKKDQYAADSLPAPLGNRRGSIGAQPGHEKPGNLRGAAAGPKKNKHQATRSFSPRPKQGGR